MNWSKRTQEIKKTLKKLKIMQLYMISFLSVPHFDGRLPALMIEGTEYEDEEEEESASNPSPDSSLSTTIDNWWENLLNNPSS